jgi:hypothetical protein
MRACLSRSVLWRHFGRFGLTKMSSRPKALLYHAFSPAAAGFLFLAPDIHVIQAFGRFTSFLKHNGNNVTYLHASK